jgi:hypothetical protein
VGCYLVLFCSKIAGCSSVTSALFAPMLPDWLSAIHSSLRYPLVVSESARQQSVPMEYEVSTGERDRAIGERVFLRPRPGAIGMPPSAENVEAYTPSLDELAAAHPGYDRWVVKPGKQGGACTVSNLPPSATP